MELRRHVGPIVFAAFLIVDNKRQTTSETPLKVATGLHKLFVS
jgi:hypothetical protein